ncbi:MAG TPA: SDR family oxidoreductase [Candidatus Paceibacterota bacterium]|nr:SDR family oxidoreductase [Candidatus Paceibacterota bacterium]
MIIKDKVVVITGASKGLGKALAQAFINEGSKVVVSSSDKRNIKTVAKEIGALGMCADVTKEKNLTKLAKKTIKKFGKIDIWVNNAGVWIPKMPVEDLDMDLVKKMFKVNVFGVINGSRVAIRVMKENESGMILNVISDSALKDKPRVSASVYGASKWAVNGFSKAIRGEDKNISVLSIYPGAMKTEIFGKMIPENFDSFMEVSYVADKVINNLKLDNPEVELILQKP